MATKVLQCWWLLFTMINSGDCIKCFQCNSHFDVGCDVLESNNIWSIFYKDCDEYSVDNRAFCRRTHLTVKTLSGDNHERIIRSCGWNNDPKNRTCYYVYDMDHSETVCQCFEDGCNSSSNMYFTLLSILILVCISLHLIT